MGLSIDREHFDEADHTRFATRLERCLGALETLLERPGFGAGAPSLGAELEVSLVDREARPLPRNVEVLAESSDPRMTVELNRFNLECNLRHTSLAGEPLSALRTEFDGALAELSRAARPHGGRVAMVGILPTILAEDLQSSAMTDTLRYRALSRALQRAKREPFLVRIDGSDPLEVRCDDVTFEGAATSLQLHLRVDPREFAGIFNAVQLATAPALAVAGNSPTFLGHRLWDETRVALFKQSVDVRDAEDKRRKRPPRVSFGTRWVRDGALELFAEAVDHYPVLLPVVGDDDPLECLEAGLIPGMEEIRLHQGTVWNWNRPVYDPAEGGHLRIEMRALPSGPSVPDMLANAAFLVGLALGLAPRATALCQEVSFEDARHSFYRAAQSGLEARLVWPRSLGGSETPVTARRLVPRLLPTARRGLASVGVASDEIDEHLGIIEERCATARTGAAWQREALSILGTRVARREALVAMLERYLEAAGSGSPVHRWPLPA